MIHKFKIEKNGAWKTPEGYPYTVVCVKDDDKRFSKQNGWSDSLEGAIKAAKDRVKGLKDKADTEAKKAAEQKAAEAAKIAAEVAELTGAADESGKTN